MATLDSLKNFKSIPRLGWRKGHYVAVVGLVLVYVALLIAAAHTRKPWNDEAMSADAAYNLSTRGETGVDFFDEQSPFFPGIRRHTYYIFPFQLCVLAVWYKLAGFSLVSTRVISILWTLLMLGAIYCLVRTLTRDITIAGLAALLTAIDYHIMTEAAFGRYDTMVAALGFSAYALYVRLRERNLRVALLAGNVCVVMAGATHPNGLLFFIGLWFIILYFDRQRIRWRDLCLCGAPYVIASAIWAGFILQDFPSFKSQLTMNAGGRTGLLHPIETLLKEIRIRYIIEFGLGPHSAGHATSLVRLKALSLAAYLTGILGCLLSPSIRRRPEFRMVFVLTGIHWAYMTFYENMKFSYYLVYLLPLYCVVLAIFAVSLWRSLPSVAPRWAIAAAMALVGVVQIGGIAAKIRIDDYGRSYIPAVEFVRQHASASDSVNASCSFGFGYGFDRNLMDDPTLGFYNGRKPQYLVAEEIYDDWWEGIKVVEPEIYTHVMKTRNEYDLIYNHENYRVYRRRSPRPDAQ